MQEWLTAVDNNVLHLKLIWIGSYSFSYFSEYSACRVSSRSAQVDVLPFFDILPHNSQKFHETPQIFFYERSYKTESYQYDEFSTRWQLILKISPWKSQNIWRTLDSVVGRKSIPKGIKNFFFSILEHWANKFFESYSMHWWR